MTATIHWPVPRASCRDTAASQAAAGVAHTSAVTHECRVRREATGARRAAERRNPMHAAMPRSTRPTRNL